MLIRFKAFIKNNSGGSAMEYSLLGVLIAVAIAAGVNATGAETVEMYECAVRAFSGEDCRAAAES